MKYSCGLCNFTTSHKFDYGKHLKTKKHKTAELNLKTKETNTEQSNNVSNQVKELSDQMVDLRKQIIDKDKLFETVLTTITTVVTEKNKDVEFLKNMVSKAGVITEKSIDVANKSMSALTFLQTYYNNAPALMAPIKWLPEYKTIGHIDITDSDNEEEIYDEEYYRVEKRRKIMNNINTTNEDNFVIELNGKKNILHEEIGKMILSSIKKDDPKIQSLWCSDVARLSYLMRDIVDKNQNIAEWKIDKRGTKMCDILVKPLLEEIIAITKDFMKRSFDKIATGCGDTMSHLNMNEEITQLLDLLYSTAFTNQIKKYVAGALYLNKNDDIKQIAE